jgi:hypothetical protein
VELEKSRQLIYFPVVHTRIDMGMLGESIEVAALHKIGRTAFKRKVMIINKMWMDIEKAIEALNLDYKKVRLFQDGLPVCGRELEIIKDLASAGSRNYILLLNLIEKGATIMGTEFAELLVEEYQLVQQTVSGSATSEKVTWQPSQKALSDSLLQKRDRFIARRINTSLIAGETGILFMGMLHSVEKWLDCNIRVIYPLSRPVVLRGGEYVRS